MALMMNCLQLFSRGVVTRLGLVGYPYPVAGLGSRSPCGLFVLRVPLGGSLVPVPRRISIATSAQPDMTVAPKNPQDYRCLNQLMTTASVLWMDRASVHEILENAPEFQPTVFPVQEFEKFLYLPKSWNVLNPCKEDFLCASSADLVEFVRFQTTTMGREDFREACRHISNCLPNFADDELLEIMKVLYLIPHEGGNKTLIWNILDEELCARFARSTQNSDFFLRVFDVIYWLNMISRSSFTSLYLMKAIKFSSVCNYSHGIQTLFYLSCIPWDWRSRIDARPLINFLDKIKNECDFSSFLIAAESFSVLQHSRASHLKLVVLPQELQRFLVWKGSEQINDDNTLTVICQLLYSCSSNKADVVLMDTFLKKVIDRGHISCLIFFYVLEIAVKCNLKHEKILEKMETSVIFEKVHPRVLINILLKMYGSYGRAAVLNLAKIVNTELRTRDICTLSEGHLLKSFLVLMDCGIFAFNLWELTMNGDFLVPNFINQRGSDRNLNALHLTADDLIAVFNPEYKGSRLSDILRKQLYLEYCNSSEAAIFQHNQSLPGFVDVIQKLTNGCAVATHILPGMTAPGIKDVIVCVDEQGSCHHFNVDYMKPWDVKKIPPTSGHNVTYFALWTCHHNWSLQNIRLKHNVLQRLGYISVLIETDVWSLPECQRARWIYSKLKMLA